MMSEPKETHSGLKGHYPTSGVKHGACTENLMTMMFIMFIKKKPPPKKKLPCWMEKEMDFAITTINISPLRIVLQHKNRDFH